VGAVFAVSCMSGKEIETKDLLQKHLQLHGVTIVKGIFANETHTEIVQESLNEVDSSDVTDNDVQGFLELRNIRNAINNRRLQLEVLSRYDEDEHVSQLRLETRKEINQLERKAKRISRRSKSIKSVLRGYILIELTMNSTYLPTEIWNVISSLSRNCSSPVKVVSQYPIIEKELEQFYKTIEKEKEIEIVIDIEKEKTFDEVKLEQKELLEKLNETNNKVESIELENKLNDLHTDVVDKVNDLIEYRYINEYIQKVKAFVKRGKKKVSLPKELYKELYKDNELLEIDEKLRKRDFLTRIERYTNKIGIGK